MTAGNGMRRRKSSEDAVPESVGGTPEHVYADDVRNRFSIELPYSKRTVELLPAVRAGNYLQGGGGEGCGSQLRVGKKKRKGF